MCQECNEKQAKTIEAIERGDGEAFRKLESELWTHKCIAHLHIDPAPQQESLFELEEA
jgi:hypothetical protein